MVPPSSLFFDNALISNFKKTINFRRPFFSKGQLALLNSSLKPPKLDILLIGSPLGQASRY